MPKNSPRLVGAGTVKVGIDLGCNEFYPNCIQDWDVAKFCRAEAGAGVGAGAGSGAGAGAG